MSKYGKLTLWIFNSGTFNSWEFYRKQALLDAAVETKTKLEIVQLNDVNLTQVKKATTIVIESVDIGKVNWINEINKTTNLIVISGDEEIASKYIGLNVAFADLTVFYLESFAKKYNFFENTFLLPEAADYRKNIDITYPKIKKALYVGAPYPRRKKIIEKIEEIDVYGRKEWQYFSSKKYRGIMSNSEYYDTIGKYTAFLCLMELNDSTPHLNAKIFDAIVAGVIPITPEYAPFDNTYNLPRDCYYSYKKPNEINGLVEKITELSEQEYRSKIDNLRQSQKIFSYDMQYKKLFKSIEGIKKKGLREWDCSGAFGCILQKRLNIINRLTELIQRLDIKRVPLCIEIMGVTIPSRFSPLHLNQTGSFQIHWPMFDPDQSILNLPVIKIC